MNEEKYMCYSSIRNRAKKYKDEAFIERDNVKSEMDRRFVMGKIKAYYDIIRFTEAMMEKVKGE